MREVARTCGVGAWWHGLGLIWRRDDGVLASERELIAIDADSTYADATTTDPFITIPYAEPLAPYERAELQRVKLTRGTLLAMGLPTDVPDADEPMNAELMVGEDGIPRAVRILN